MKAEPRASHSSSTQLSNTCWAGKYESPIVCISSPSDIKMVTFGRAAAGYVRALAINSLGYRRSVRSDLSAGQLQVRERPVVWGCD